MRVIADLSELDRVERALALGTFDGVHSGHRAVIGLAVELAAERGLRSTVVTFDRHPLEVLDPLHVPPLLTPMAEKLHLIEQLGPDELVLLPFDAQLAALAPDAFCDELLIHTLGARVAVVGENFHFGAGGVGDAEYLRRRSALHGCDAHIVRLVTGRGETISSTRIRGLLVAGEIDEMRELLGRPLAVEGTVVSGDGRGRLLGFPTANIEVEVGAVLPSNGVYAGRLLARGVSYRAAVNVGTHPTFPGAEGASPIVEAFLLGFKGDLYGWPVRLDFLRKLRDERRFSTAEELVRHMRHDITAVAELEDPLYRAAAI